MSSRSRSARRRRVVLLSVALVATSACTAARVAPRTAAYSSLVPPATRAGQSDTTQQLLTLMSDEEFVNIAWDGGAVTTGPVTVPLKITIGIALSHATGFAEGFGIL